MIDDGELREVDEQAFGARKFGSGAGDVGALLKTGIAGALFGGLVVWVFRSLQRFAEPPIRVKGGSLYLDLPAGWVWEPIGGSGKWRIKGSVKNSDRYDVSLVTSGVVCSPTNPQGHKVTFEHTDGKAVRSVELKVSGNQTHVSPSHPLSLANQGRRLKWDVEGHISKVDVDGAACQFGKGQLIHADLWDC